jgi:hypothetical protein
MRVSIAVFVVAIFSLSYVVCAAQSPTDAGPTQTIPSAAQGPPPAPLAPSALLRPSLDAVFQTVNALKLDKWKKGTVRDEAGENVSKILLDLHTKLPPLLTEADSNPGTISKTLPVSQNIDALYDVLLRVFDGARVSAPADQIAQLNEALNTLMKAHLALDNNLQESAVAVEKQVADLETNLQAQKAVKCPVTPAPAIPACTPPPAKKVVVKKKPKPTATPPPASPAPAAATPKTQN